MDGTPFQISKGFLFYKNASENLVDGSVLIGSYDSISMVNLQSLERKVILTPTESTGPRYDIYNWQLSGTKLYFSALDQTDGSKVVTGIVDTLALRNADLATAAESTYLTIQETASAIGAAAEVNDIAVIQPSRPENDPGGTAKAEFFTHRENLNSVSIEFTKYMNQDEVLAGITFTNDGDSSDIGFVPLWIFKSLHLIPDTDDGILSLTNNTGKGLDTGTTYTVSLSDTVNDYYDALIDSTSSTFPLTATFTTLPSSGWYLGDTDSTDTALSANEVAKFAGIANPNTDYEEFYKLADNLPANFTLEFSAKNIGWQQVGVNIYQHDGSTYRYDGQILAQTLDSYSASASYRDDTFYNNYQWESYYNQDDGTSINIATGNWMRYRVTVFGSNYTFSVSEDGTTFTDLHTITDMKSAANAELYLRLTEQAFVDNIVLTTTTLDTDGITIIPASSEGNLMNVTFDSPATFAIDLPGFTSETSDCIAVDYGAAC